MAGRISRCDCTPIDFNKNKIDKNAIGAVSCVNLFNGIVELRLRQPVKIGDYLELRVLRPKKKVIYAKVQFFKKKNCITVKLLNGNIHDISNGSVAYRINQERAKKILEFLKNVKKIPVD